MSAANTGARYARRFAELKAKGEGAFMPFFMLGDPDLETSFRLIEAAVAAGADLLEVGIPFSDPVADGPVIQAAADRALAAGADSAACFALLARVRAAHPDLPIGVLTYANLVIHRGREAFYDKCAAAGVDSVLIADVPAFEAPVFVEAARARGIASVLIAAPHTPDATLARVADLGDGYIYCVGRAGVTGADRAAVLDHAPLFAKLSELGAPPGIVGFGISEPDQVKAALAQGAAGVVTGSALVAEIERHLGDEDAMLAAVVEKIRALKAATAPPSRSEA